MDKTPYLKYKNIYIIPTFHSRIEFARLVRIAYFKVFPDVIAIELPDNMRDEVTEGIERLPFLSLIAYADTLNPKKMNFIPIDPVIFRIIIRPISPVPSIFIHPFPCFRPQLFPIRIRGRSSIPPEAGFFHAKII